MNNELKGKKLLILGATSVICDMVKAAQALGVYTIVTDYNPVEKAPAKLIADEYWNDSIMDYETIVSKIKSHHVDGVLTGFTDSLSLPYQHICELSGQPCYATKEVFELTMDKAKFKKMCRDNGVPTIPEYDLASFDPDIISEKNKVIIKPIDNSGSRGVVLCSSPDDFQRFLDYALSFSQKKQVIIEKYMEMDSISLSYTFQDGVASLSTTDDRYVHKSLSGSSVTQCGLYPSKYSDSYIEKWDAKVRRMFENAGLKNGVAAIQFFTDGNEFYAMEMGHRITGGQHYNYTLMENGISALDCMIHYAITGRMADYRIAEKDNPNFKNTYCHLFILGKEAVIARMEGLDYLQELPEVFNLSLMKQVGDKVGKDGTSAQKVVGLHMKVNDVPHLKKVMEGIERSFHIYDESGNDLTIYFNKNIL